MEEALAKLSPAEIRSWITDAKGMICRSRGRRRCFIALALYGGALIVAPRVGRARH